MMLGSPSQLIRAGLRQELAIRAAAAGGGGSPWRHTVLSRRVECPTWLSHREMELTQAAGPFCMLNLG